MASLFCPAPAGAKTDNFGQMFLFGEALPHQIAQLAGGFWRSLEHAAQSFPERWLRRHKEGLQ